MISRNHRLEDFMMIENSEKESLPPLALAYFLPQGASVAANEGFG